MSPQPRPNSPATTRGQGETIMRLADEDGRPGLVPPLEARTPTEQRRMREAELRRANRLAERAQIIAHREGERQ